MVSGAGTLSVYEVRPLGEVKARSITPRYERTIPRVEHQCRMGFAIISVVERKSVSEGRLGACAKDFWES